MYKKQVQTGAKGFVVIEDNQKILDKDKAKNGQQQIDRVEAKLNLLLDKLGVTL